MREFVRKKRQYNTHFTSQKFDSHVNSLNFNKLTQQPKFYSVLVGRSTSFLQYSDLLVDRFTLYWSACRQVYTLLVGMSIGLHFVGRQVDRSTALLVGKSIGLHFVGRHVDKSTLCWSACRQVYILLVGMSIGLHFDGRYVDRSTLCWSACRQVYTLMVGMSIGLHFVGRQVDNFTLFKSASIYFHTFYLLNRGLSVYCRFIKYLLNRGLSVY